VRTLRQGGKVNVVAEDEMSGDASAMAILRY
jgi:hypothetical protein